MIAKHVLLGSFFTLVGVVSLLVPAIPFIFIGALVFGLIELAFGLMGHEGVAVPPDAVKVEVPGETLPVEVTTDRSGDLQRVVARVVTRTPDEHVVEAAYERTVATVSLDGRPFATLKRGYLRKEARDVNVPLEGSGKVLTVRFWGRMMPQIDLLLNGVRFGRL